MSSNNPLKTRPAQPSVLSRLQNYWPSHTNTHDSSSTKPRAKSGGSSETKQPRFLKVRIVTWNMHDSLPKGDLEELLGKVSPYKQSKCTLDGFPIFPNEDVHPYHLVVVAGQECPTLSGIPMGLGASFKTRIHEKEKEKEKSKENVEKLEAGSKPQESTQKKEKGKNKQRPGIKIEYDREKRMGRKKSDQDTTSHDYVPTGWTQMVEDWLCHGRGCENRIQPLTVAEVGMPKPLMRRVTPREPRSGPYELLVKERLMGIYMAIYIHRDIKHMVKGTSKSAITTGLVGGRVGNKGGVGISVNLDGTTFLFLNTHLAAHGNRVNHRLANLSKIKTELSVESYLKQDDPRIMAEDLTDTFDFTFLCGDLNFRLDVTRLHADWLISRQEYAQALHFDQLKKLMKEGKGFVGFQEGIINFPPTFKYDVLRTLKGFKRNGSKQSQVGTPILTSHEQLENPKIVTEVEEDTLSIAFSSSSSDSSMEEQAGSTNFYAPQSPEEVAVSPKAAHRAKKTWLAFLSPLSPRRSRKSIPLVAKLTTPRPNRQSLEVPATLSISTTTQRHSFDFNKDEPDLRPPVIPYFNSTNSSLRSDDGIDDPDKGVYDSSMKQRVPSWCDRILWKSTLQPEPESADINNTLDGMPTRAKPPLMKLFAMALRPTPMKPELQSAPFSRFAQEPGTILNQSRSHSENLQDKQSSSSTTGKEINGRPPRRITSVGIAPTSTPTTSPVRHSSDGPPVSSPTRRDSFWRFVPAILSPSTVSQSSPKSSAIGSPAIEPPKPQKGDVVCLTYRTLDDASMRRLEGRSDHRPVIGAYAAYF